MEDEAPKYEQDAGGGGPKWAYVGIFVMTCVFAVLYHGLIGSPYRNTSLMFLGIPAVLAIVLALLPKAKSATGSIVKGITFALVIVAPLMGEGYLCILMAAPLFYLVGILVGVIVDWNRERRGATLSCCAVLLLPMALEGVAPQWTFNRLQMEEATRTVNAPAEAVEAALAQSQRVGRGCRGS